MDHQDLKASKEAIPQQTDHVAKQVVEAAYAVHHALGPGLLESVYEACMVHELDRRGLKVEKQAVLPIHYDGVRLDAGLRLDLVVDERLVVELKAVETLLPIHQAQLLTYLKLSGFRLALLGVFVPWW